MIFEVSAYKISDFLENIHLLNFNFFFLRGIFYLSRMRIFMWDFIYAEHRFAQQSFSPFFFFYAQQRRTRLAFRGVLFSFCARITKRNVDARTETHYAACIFINGSASLYVRAFLTAWKRRCWRSARDAHIFIILFSPATSASRRRSRIYDESITR